MHNLVSTEQQIDEVKNPLSNTSFASKAIESDNIITLTNSEKTFKNLKSIGFSISDIQAICQSIIKAQNDYGENKISVFGKNNKRERNPLNKEAINRINIKLRGYNLKISGIKLTDNNSAILIYTNPDQDLFAITILDLNTRKSNSNKHTNNRDIERAIYSLVL